MLSTTFKTNKHTNSVFDGSIIMNHGGNATTEMTACEVSVSRESADNPGLC